MDRADPGRRRSTSPGTALGWPSLDRLVGRPPRPHPLAPPADRPRQAGATRRHAPRPLLPEAPRDDRGRDPPRLRRRSSASTCAGPTASSASRSTRPREARILLDVPAEKIAVIPNGVDPAYREAVSPSEVRRRARAPAPAAGRVALRRQRREAQEPREPRHGVHGARPQRRAPCRRSVLVGPGSHWAQGGTIAGGAQIHATGYLETREIRALMAASVALVLPSLEEGFGLPVAEAMAAGLPVVCSRGLGARGGRGRRGDAREPPRHRLDRRRHRAAPRRPGARRAAAAPRPRAEPAVRLGQGRRARRSTSTATSWRIAEPAHRHRRPRAPGASHRNGTLPAQPARALARPADDTLRPLLQRPGAAGPDPRSSARRASRPVGDGRSAWHRLAGVAACPRPRATTSSTSSSRRPTPARCRCARPARHDVHDLSFFSWPDDFTARGCVPPTRLSVAASVRASRRIVAVSDFTRREILARFPSRRRPRRRGPARRRRRPAVATLARGSTRAPRASRAAPPQRRLDPQPPASPVLLDALRRLARVTPAPRLDVVGENRTHPRLDLGQAGRGSGPRAPRPPLGLRRATRGSRIATPRPTSPSTCRSTRASACRCSRRWRAACPWSRARGRRPARSSRTRRSSSSRPTPPPWPARSSAFCRAARWRDDLVARGRALAPRHSWAEAAARTHDVLREAAGQVSAPRLRHPRLVQHARRALARARLAQGDGPSARDPRRRQRQQRRVRRRPFEPLIPT